MPKILWILSFFVSYMKLNRLSLDFGLLIGQNKIFEDNALGLTGIFHYFVTADKIINQ